MDGGRNVIARYIAARIFINATVCLSRTKCTGRSGRRRAELRRPFCRHPADRAAKLHSDPNRWRVAGAEPQVVDRLLRADRDAGAKSQDPARPAAGFHRTARPFLQAGNDTRRRIVDSRKTFETSARATDDAALAPGVGRWPQFLASVARVSTNFSAALREHGRRGRSERRAAGYSAATGRAFDAGEKSARQRAAGADLSGCSGGGRRCSDHDFHHLHGAAVDGFMSANWRRAAVADAHSLWRCII